MKGQNSTYRPEAGTVCLVSGPNMDDDDGYTFMLFTILWCDDIFVLYGMPGCWPNLHKWDQVIAKPDPARLAAAAPELLECVQEFLKQGDFSGTHWLGEKARAAIAKITA